MDPYYTLYCTPLNYSLHFQGDIAIVWLTGDKGKGQLIAAYYIIKNIETKTQIQDAVIEDIKESEGHSFRLLDGSNRSVRYFMCHSHLPHPSSLIPHLQPSSPFPYFFISLFPRPLIPIPILFYSLPSTSSAPPLPFPLHSLSHTHTTHLTSTFPLSALPTLTFPHLHHIFFKYSPLPRSPFHTLSTSSRTLTHTNSSSGVYKDF